MAETSFDDVRSAFPHLRLAVYALTIGGPVVFEVIDETGAVFSFRGSSAAEAINAAFPPPYCAPDAGPIPAEEPSIFD